MELSERCKLISYTSKDLKQFTKEFDEKLFLGDTQFGKLYRGKIKIQHGLNQTKTKEVTVKIWVLNPLYRWGRGSDKHSRFQDEIYFLQHPSMKDHPNYFVKPIGYCWERELLGVVYDINPVDTLHNLILKENFDWLQRIKVAIGFARLLNFFHDRESPYMVRNIDAAHIMIDQDCNPRLFEFGLLSGGIMGDKADMRRERLYGTAGYMDYHLLRMGVWSVKCDVYTYGVVLLSLMAKRVVDVKIGSDTYVDDWATKEYKTNNKCSLVHKSLELDSAYDARDGPEITELAMSCLELNPRIRPTMKEIVCRLQKLHVSQSHAEDVGIQQMLGDFQSTYRCQ